MLTKRLIYLTVFFIFFSQLYGAAPILQVKLAHKWFDMYGGYNTKQKQEFVLGSLINEIDHLDKVFSTQLPWEHVTLKDVIDAPSAFEAGRKYNYFLKVLREKHLSRNSLLDFIHGVADDSKDFFLKLLEDEVVYEPELCSKACSYLSAIAEGEILSGIKVDRLAMWHGVLYKYLAQRPSESLDLFKRDQRIKLELSEEELALWKIGLVFFASQKKIKDYVEGLIEDVEISLEMCRLKFLD